MSQSKRKRIICWRSPIALHIFPTRANQRHQEERTPTSIKTWLFVCSVIESLFQRRRCNLKCLIPKHARLISHWSASFKILLDSLRATISRFQSFTPSKRLWFRYLTQRRKRLMMQLLKKMMRQTTLIHVDWTVMNLKISLHYSKVCKSKRMM